MTETKTLSNFLAALPKADFNSRLTTLRDYFDGSPGAENIVRMTLLALVPNKTAAKSWHEATELFRNKYAVFAAQLGGNESGIINDQDLKRFCECISENRNKNFRTLLTVCVIDELNARPKLWENRIIIGAIFHDNIFIKIEQYIRTGDPSNLKASDNKRDISAALSVARSMLQLKPDDFNYIGKNLFHHLPADDWNNNFDRSYYICYRYSTEERQIVKTWLCINSPKVNTIPFFSFTHGYVAQDNREQRISRGIILVFDETIYLAGKTQRGIGDNKPIRGLKLIAVPREAFVPGHQLLSALYVSNNLSWEPIVGRLALIHVGFLSSRGEYNMNAGVIKSNEILKKDLKLEFEKWVNSTKLEYKNDFRISLNSAFEFVNKKIRNVYDVDLKNKSRGRFGLRALTIEQHKEPSA